MTRHSPSRITTKNAIAIIVALFGFNGNFAPGVSKKRRAILSKYSRIPPSSAGGMNGLPSPLAASPEGPLARRGGEGLPRGVIQNTPQGKGEGEMIL